MLKHFSSTAAVLCLVLPGCAEVDTSPDLYDAPDLIDAPWDWTVDDAIPDPAADGDAPMDPWGDEAALPDVIDAADLPPEDAPPESEPDTPIDMPPDIPVEDTPPDTVDVDAPPDIPDEEEPGADLPADLEPEDLPPELPDTGDAVDVEAEGCDPGVFHAYTATDVPRSIPDSDPGGVASWIDVTDCDFDVWDVRVAVNIDHSYIGDLTVSLVSPDGRRTLLHNGTGGGADDIMTTYPTLTEPAQTLCSVTRQSSLGRWGLFVADTSWLDSGDLVSWSLELSGAASGCRSDWWYSTDAFPMSIPDNDSGGIYSTVTITESGAITSLRVGVDISHGYIGDLSVAVTSPDATTRILHDRSGGSDSDIKTFYPTPTTPAEALDVYTGMERAGTWTLHVSDNASLDSGQLNGWLLEIN
ncbi:MAG: proprotein convertase P-domain-containing protein [Pseudomonadota bacterium]